MRRKLVLVLTLGLLLGLALLAPATPALGGTNFVAQLAGDDEVPARDTKAKGVAKFKLRDDGAALLYKVNVANIDNVFAAHIHCGAAGVNGPIGVTLFMGSPGSGAVNGTLAQGTITAPDPANACGWADLAAVLAALESGNTYVNVHTNDGVPPVDTGPGDFPGGEIRGQVR
jgi:CHRD domain